MPIGIYKHYKGWYHSEETKEKIRQSRYKMKEKFGYINSPDTRKKMSLSHKDVKLSEKHIQTMKGCIPWNKGKEHLATKGKNNYFYGKHFFGKSHPNWQGGKSFEPYPTIFNYQLKDRIRVRDNFICQLCGVPELECQRRLAIHHIDYDKTNCKEINLTSLCVKCSSKVNYNREYWTRYFKEKITYAR